MKETGRRWKLPYSQWECSSGRENHRRPDRFLGICDRFSDETNHRNKSKLQKKFRSPAFVEPVADEPLYEEENAHVAKVKTFPVKPMTVEEAILQMNLLGHTFFMFRNADSGEINVVYSRRNGDYGLLVPETE